MNPKFWGPGAWMFLHSITMNYPKNPTETDKEIYYNFFKNLEHVLPCEKCGYNYARHIQDYPIENVLHSRKLFVKWFIKIHNEVNKEIGNREYTYDEVIEDYKYKLNNLDTDPTLVYKVIIAALILFIIFTVCKK